MRFPFIVYLQDKVSLEFKLKSDVIEVVPMGNGYRITFNNGRNYHYRADKVRYYPFVSTRENVCIYESGKLNAMYDTVDNYGSYMIFRKGDIYSNPIRNSDDIEICDAKKNIEQTRSILNYFKEILKQSGGVSFDIQSEEPESKNPNQISSEILFRALDNINKSESRSAFSNYIDGINPTKAPSKEALIYPFGCNASQKLAVETALRNSISIVEGPPGTGKTQTILNIVANLIVQNKTIAIVSNNNSAVFNVREKLIKYGYGMVVASLGNNDNKVAFFDNLEKQTVDESFKLSKEKLAADKNIVRDLDAILTQCFQYKNQLARLRTQLSDAQIEFGHMKTGQPLDQNIKSKFDSKFCRNKNLEKALKLKGLLSGIDSKKKLSIVDIFRFILYYGFFSFKMLKQYNEDLHRYVNYRFYELYIAKIEAEISDIENWLEQNREEYNLKKLIETSKEIFNGVLYEKYNRLDKAEFKVETYLSQFDQFVKHYPVILSSTLSLHTSIAKGYLLDYLIIDESSQVDVIKAAVCFSCCRNVIVVGDSMQLTHIVDKQSKEVAEQLRKMFLITPAYDYVEQNILNSLKNLYGSKIKSVLLKEHYRCHPLIIGFCNKKYYNNNLVIMTSGDNNPFKIIETSVAAARDKYNQKQIDETENFVKENYSDDYTKVGVIAPYRNHANMLQKLLPDGAEADTIHKYQGREKDTIIFNTVNSKIGTFIDNPNLINVAVSRAVKEFIVVKPASMELPHGTNIGDLIRYICYTTDPAGTIVKGKLCSVFELLYKENHEAFASFMLANEDKEGSAAEILIYNLLTDNILLKNPKFSSVCFVREYFLRDLIRDYPLFSEEEIQFIKDDSRLDFLLYNDIDKYPILAIEVDGVSYHDNELQRERDKKKNHILEILELPLLRLSTDGHDEEVKIIESLSMAMAETHCLSKKVLCE